MKQCWRQARYRDAKIPLLISAAQELVLWQRIIEEHDPGLLGVASTARAARAAWLQAAEYDLPLDDLRWTEHHDAERFSTWLAELRRYCRARNWMTTGDLWRMALQWPGEPAVLAGFRELTPALSRLQHRWRLRQLHARSNGSSAMTRLYCETFEDELRQAARWARGHVDHRPDASVAVLVPELSRHIPLVQRIFREVFYPGLLLDSPLRDSSAYHISEAPPLRDHPLAAAALLIPEFLEDQIAVASVSAFLRSPFIQGAASELYLRGQADFALRRSRNLDVTLRQIQTRVADDGKNRTPCPALKTVLSRMRTIIDRKPAQAEPAVWSRLFSDLLNAAVGPVKWHSAESSRRSSMPATMRWRHCRRWVWCWGRSPVAKRWIICAGFCPPANQVLEIPFLPYKS